MWQIDILFIFLVVLFRGYIKTVTSEYFCQYIPGLVLDLDKDGIDQACKGDWSCWDSQLLDTSRIQLVDLFNTYKENLASGRLKNGIGSHYMVFKLQYHWYLEQLAMWYYINDPNRCQNDNRIEVLFKNARIPQPGDKLELGNASFGPQREDYKRAEFLVTSFTLSGDGDQPAAMKRIKEIIENPKEENLLFDAWDGGINKLGRADLFGCTLIIRDVESGKVVFGGEIKGLTRIGVLGCIFAARPDTLRTEQGQPSQKACELACGQPQEGNPNAQTCIPRNVTFDDSEHLCEWVGEQKTFKFRRPCQYYYHYENTTFRGCDRYIPASWSDLKEPDNSKMIRVHVSNNSEIVIDTRKKYTTTSGAPRTTRKIVNVTVDVDPFAPGDASPFLILVPIIICVGIFLIVVNIIF